MADYRLHPITWKKCNRLQLITITNYDYPMSVCGMELPPPYLTFCLHIYIFIKNFFIFHLFFPPFFTCSCAYPYNLACVDSLLMNKGNNKITELRTILQRESQNS